MIRDGFQVNYAEMVYASRCENHKLTLYMPFKKIAHKGETLDGGMLILEIAALRQDMITFTLTHHAGALDKGPAYHLHEEMIKPEIREAEQTISFVSGHLKGIVHLEDCTCDFIYDDHLLTHCLPHSFAMIRDDQGFKHVNGELSLSIGEKIYGLGERFGAFVKNGQSVGMWNADAGTSTQQSYKNIPFFLSSQGYGVFVNSSDKVSFEVGSEKVSRVSMSLPGESLSFTIIGGKDLQGVLSHYTDLTGKPALPPLWSFGLWLSTSFLTNYDEETVNSFVDGMKESDIPLSVFHFDCLWMQEYEWCNFEWDHRSFPHPQEMLKRLKDKGLKICVWINPYIAQKSRLFEEGKEKGYFLKKKKGDLWQWDKWQAGMAIVDFTNPEACSWYQGYLKHLIDMGVDCFKTDFGERIPTDVDFFDHSDSHKMHNYYTYLYNKTVYDLLVECLGKENAVVFARSATATCQQFPVHWGGDCTSDYASMAESLRGGLSFGLSGFGFWSHDISGFEEGATPDLYKRWTQFGLLSSHSRYHGSWEYKVPWLYGEEAVDVTRFFTKLKLSLMPYLWSQAIKTTEIGLPMMRAMILFFPQDENVRDIDTQYMLGDQLLVAPIFNNQSIGHFYVPQMKGDWIDLLSEKHYQ